MNGVTVLEPVVDVPIAPSAARPTSRILRVAREVARFVHDLLTEIP